MSLQPPNLDDRTFADLVAEARARIPRFTPEWTNLNDSDPGMTLVKLHAWLTETVLFRLNQLPDLNYLKFLELLNIEPRPAKAARAELTFALKKLNRVDDPLTVIIPKGVQVGVDDPDLEQELVFETDRTLVAINAAIGAIVVLGAGTNRLDLATEYDADAGEAKIARPFYPFGRNPTGGDVLLFGLVLRPHRQKGKDYSLDRFPAEELNLNVLVPQVFEPDAEGRIIVGPKAHECLFPWDVAEQEQAIVWEAYFGADIDTSLDDAPSWRALQLRGDDTAGLSRSGHLYLEIPPGLPAVSFRRLARSFWQDLGLHKPPTTNAELRDDIRDGFLDPADLADDVWTDQLGLADPTLDDPDNLVDVQLMGPELAFNAVDESTWLDAGYDAAPAPFGLYWLRARVIQPLDPVPQVSRIVLNTVQATAAVTRLEEVVGTSDGRPNQTHRLKRTPVLVEAGAGPDLEIEIVEQGNAEAWQSVPDFFGHGPGDAVYRVDVESGALTFGNGIHGRIPVAGAEIVARHYRYGGGAFGNAGAATVTSLKSALAEVAGVTNVRAAAGGADAESLEEARLRAPHDLRARDRAVTAEDFADLAVQTPGVSIQRAFALALTRLDSAATPPSLIANSPGAVTVVVLPEGDEETPQPSEEQLRLICAHLSARRLITTELYVVGPRYVEIEALRAEVSVSRRADLKSVGEAVVASLLDYFHPLRGGDDGRGWPFGGDVFLGNVYRRMLQVADVTRVLCLEIEPIDAQAACDDVLPIADGSLVHLPRTAIDLKVRYDGGS